MVFDTANYYVMLVCGIKTKDCWVAGVEFICERTNKIAHALKAAFITQSKQACVLITKSFKYVNELY